MFESIEESVRHSRLAQLGDPLRKLDAIDWDAFAKMITRAFEREVVSAKGGRRRYDVPTCESLRRSARHHGAGTCDGTDGSGLCRPAHRSSSTRSTDMSKSCTGLTSAPSVRYPRPGAPAAMVAAS